MLKAIETVYKGYKFRSRLEARWAVVFDALGIEYRYEMEGFELNGNRYLPDFYLQDIDYGFVECSSGNALYETSSMFVEIKPRAPTHAEKQKVRMLAEDSGKPCLILAGDVYPSDVVGWLWEPLQTDTHEANVWRDTVDQRHWQFIDGEDGVFLTYRYQSLWDSAKMWLDTFFKYSINPPITYKKYEGDHFAAHNPLVTKAYLEARASRFE